MIHGKAARAHEGRDGRLQDWFLMASALPQSLSTSDSTTKLLSELLRLA